MACTGLGIILFSKVAVLKEAMGMSEADAVQGVDMRIAFGTDGASIIRIFIFLTLNHYWKSYRDNNFNSSNSLCSRKSGASHLGQAYLKCGDV